MRYGTTTDTLTDSLVIIDGHDVTNLVTIEDGHIACDWCDQPIIDEQDLTHYDSDRYSREGICHYDCTRDLYDNE